MEVLFQCLLPNHAGTGVVGNVRLNSLLITFSMHPYLQVLWFLLTLLSCDDDPTSSNSPVLLNANCAFRPGCTQLDRVTGRLYNYCGWEHVLEHQRSQKGKLYCTACPPCYPIYMQALFQHMYLRCRTPNCSTKDVLLLEEVVTMTTAVYYAEIW